MTVSHMSRRAMLRSATALGALAATSDQLLAQGARRTTPLPLRREFVIRNATVLTMDPNIADLARGDVHVRDGAIVAVGPRLNTPSASDRRQRHDLHAGHRRHALAPVDDAVPSVRARRRRCGRLLPGEQSPGPAHGARGQLPQRQARRRRSPERGRDHGAQLGAQRAQPRACRRRALRHARHGHPRTLRLWPGAGHAGRPGDGSRRARAHQARLDAERRHAHARHLLAQRRRHEHRRRCARHAHHRDGEEGLERRARARRCRSRCTPRAQARSCSSRRRVCSAPTCSSCIRCSRRPRSARS